MILSVRAKCSYWFVSCGNEQIISSFSLILKLLPIAECTSQKGMCCFEFSVTCCICDFCANSVHVSHSCLKYANWSFQKISQKPAVMTALLGGVSQPPWSPPLPFSHWMMMCLIMLHSVLWCCIDLVHQYGAVATCHIFIYHLSSFTPDSKLFLFDPNW